MSQLQPTSSISSEPLPARKLAPEDVPHHLRAVNPTTWSGLTFPHFLGIGAQKAGTSWLWEMLARHPDLYLPHPKEQHYFDRELETVAPELYAARFQTGDQRLTGEITPAYATLSGERVRFIRALMPDVRLIFLLRNPVDRAWSQALMNLIMHDGRRYEDIPQADFFAHFDSPHATARGMYSTTIDLWERTFSREQLLVDFYDQIKIAPHALLGRVMKHIGASVPSDWSAFPTKQVFLEGVKIPMPDVYRDYLQRKFHDEIERLHDRFGSAVSSWRSR